MFHSQLSVQSWYQLNLEVHPVCFNLILGTKQCFQSFCVNIRYPHVCGIFTFSSRIPNYLLEENAFCFRYAGILSAYGMALADVVHEAQEPCALHYSPENFVKIDERISVLTQQCIEELQRQGFNR